MSHLLLLTCTACPVLSLNQPCPYSAYRATDPVYARSQLNSRIAVGTLPPSMPLMPYSTFNATIHKIAAVACCADSLICSVEGIPGSNEGTSTQDDEDFGDGGYHEAFKEYCLYARKR